MMETSCIKTGYRSNSFDIRKRQAVEVGKYEAENGSKSVLYRDREGYFLEECNLHPAIDESDKSVVGILTSKAYPFDRVDAYEWAREGHCDPSVLLAEFYDDNPDLLTITGHKMAVIITPNGESVFMYLSDEIGSFPVNMPRRKLWYFKKMFDSYEITEEEAFEDLSDILSEYQKEEQLFKVLLSKPEIEKISGTKYCINGYTVIAMNCFE